MKNSAQIAALVATHNRTYLLSSRSIPSILRQSHPPNYLVVVDDSDNSKDQQANETFLQSISSPVTEVIYLRNYRTPGAAGAWNTGLDHLLRRNTNPENQFIAILDDDDEWDSDHLHECINAANSNNLDMVVSGICRHSYSNQKCHFHSIPQRLSAEDFLIGNPHIQGSNFFIRLTSILQAGTFDEDLTSSTDRDLCIRLSDLGYIRFGSIDRYTVHHYTSGDRLSSPNDLKQQGLNKFWQKYQSRMTASHKQLFIERTRKLFNWEPATHHTPVIVKDEQKKILDTKCDVNPGIHFIVGVIGDNTAPQQLESLLDDLSVLNDNPFVSGLDIIVLENNIASNPGSLNVVCKKALENGLRILLINSERQDKDSKEGFFGNENTFTEEHLCIATARTRIQRYLYEFSESRMGAVIWILDDDSRLDNLLIKNNDEKRQFFHYFKDLDALKKTGVSCCIGNVTGDAPVPFASTIRVQLVDIYHNLAAMTNMEVSDRWLSRSDLNNEFRINCRDYYYDLSRQSTNQLERIFWLESESKNENVGEVFRRLADKVERILAGGQVTRPLIQDESIDPVLCGREGVHRGGNTFIFDRELLRNTPNFAIRINGSMSRRSDMIWALVNRSIFNKRIIEVQIPVRQDRSYVKTNELDLEKLVSDITGYALYSALEDVLNNRQDRTFNLSSENPVFSREDVTLFNHKVHKYIEERFAAFRLNYYRIKGLLKSIDNMLIQLKQVWITSDLYPQLECAIEKFESFLHQIEEQYQENLPSVIKSRIYELSDSEISSFPSELISAIKSYQETFESPTTIKNWFSEERINIAETHVKRICQEVQDLRCLGIGAEGVVFTDEVKVYKYFDYWKVKNSEEKRNFLRNLIDKWKLTETLYPLEQLIEDGVHAILIYPFEQSNKYEGGHGSDLIKLLKECREVGIICRNIHPKNLIITHNGVKLIDYGSDIYPYSMDEFKIMARRAYLSWRWYFRPDLPELMRKSIKSDDLPELEEFERFYNAIDPSPAIQDLDEFIIREIEFNKPKSLLDYGCGKGKIASRISGMGIHVTGYDPDPDLTDRWKVLSDKYPKLKFTSELDSLNHKSKFDMVVASLVLCAIPNEEEYNEVLSNLRKFISVSGIVIIAICNPFFTLSASTPLQERHVDGFHSYEESFEWRKKVNSSEMNRIDFHRPLHKIRKDLLKHGLIIKSISQTQTMDLNRFEPNSDFLMLKLAPLPKFKEKISLLIKSCTMEWETIEHQVKHIVNQLEGPRVFHEKILVVDVKRDNFNRQYTESKETEYISKVKKLQQDRVIDKVIFTPSDVQIISTLNSRWFDISDPSTHALNGGQVASTIYGFEACSGEYILQVDSDLMFGRVESSHDYLGDKINVLKHDEEAVTVSLNIYHANDSIYTSEKEGNNWRVEVRGSLWQRERLFSLRPLPNEISEGKMVLAWHRSVDQKIKTSEWKSYRGGDHRTFFIHPLNKWKINSKDWMNIVERVESGSMPQCQLDHVNLEGSLHDWLIPKRTEPYIFMIGGRNVRPGTFQRCLNSVKKQYRQDWGAIVIDDASNLNCSDYAKLACMSLSKKITFLHNPIRRGLMENMIMSIKEICTNPNSVIVTMDADDSLIGRNVIDILDTHYSAGADVTVGSMLRTDKQKQYPVDFDSPRIKRGGNVWQHLRSFRKYLFDAIPLSNFQVNQEYVELANDWAYMLPIIENAKSPVWIKKPLYLYEPSGIGKGSDREEREKIIEKIIEKKSLMESVNA